MDKPTFKEIYLFLFCFKRHMQVQRKKVVTTTSFLITILLSYAHLTRAPTGGISAPLPLRFFMNSGKTAARSAAKFGMTIYLSILRVVCKW